MKRSTETRDIPASRRRDTRLAHRSRSKRRYSLEQLEGRALLSYTFSYNSGTQAATVTGTSAVDSLVIEPVSGFLEYSVNGGGFSGNWGGNSVPASPTVTVSIGLSTGEGSSLTLGTSTGPASALLATFDVTAGANTTDTLSIDDSTGTTLASGAHPYSIATAVSGGTITGPGFVVNEQSNAMSGGVTLKGSPVNGDIYNVPSVRASEPFNLVAHASTTNTINVGNAGSTQGVNSTLVVTGPATLNLDDSADQNAIPVTLDNLSGNVNAAFEVLGLSPGAIEYGPSISALTIHGGNVEDTLGIAFNINNTQANTPTTIYGGTKQNHYNLSNSGLGGGLDNLLGAVTIHGGAALNDVITLDDSSANRNDTYTVTGTTVGRAVFAGLTYDGTVGTLNLNAGDTLGTNGNNTINVNSTANGVTTNINGQNGSDTITVNSTGTGASVNITAGHSDDSTVNVVADGEPVNITFNSPEDTINGTVNIGSTGGAGSMTGILGAIGITDSESYYTLTFHDENDATARTWTLNNSDAGVSGAATVALSGGIATTSYRPGDLNSPLTIDGGSGGNTFQVNDTTSFATTVLNTGTGADTVNVPFTGDAELDINGQDGLDTVILGASTGEVLGMQGLTGSIYVGNANGHTALTLDDSQDTAGRTARLADADGTDTITGLSPASIHAEDDGLRSLLVLGGSGGDHFTVDGTFADPENNPSPTTINTGTGVDTTTVRATALHSTLTINGQAGADTALISDDGSVAGIEGTVSVTNALGHTALTVDASADSGSHNAFLSGGVTQSTLQNLAPASIFYNTAQLSSLTVDTGPSGSQTLQVNFDQYNPIPTFSSPGLFFNAGASSLSDPNSHTLVFFNQLSSGPFRSEVHNAEDPSVSNQTLNYGSYAFVDANQVASGVNYSGVQQNVDFTPATNYTFNDHGYFDQSFGATNGETLLGLDSIRFQSTPTPTSPLNFATTTVTLKQNITFATRMAEGLFSYGLDGVVDIPTTPAALQSLTFNTTNDSQNQVNFVATPAGVLTTLNGGTNADTTNVAGVNVPAESALILNAGPGQDTLTFDAGGLQPDVFPNDGPGVVLSVPGHGNVIAIGYQSIRIIHAATPTITPGPGLSFAGVEGTPMTNVIVGTFTFPLPGTIPGPLGLPASDFTGSISWGDLDPSATIVQDASNPSVYDIIGSHTFLVNGNYVVTNRVSFVGGTISSLINGELLSIDYLPSGPISGNNAVAVVAQGTIGVNVLPFVGTEGTTIASAPIATFTDSGGVQPAENFTATLTITGPDGFSLTLPAAGISQDGNAALYTVTAPAFTLPQAGHYQVVVSVTDNAGVIPANAQGSSTVAIADAPLTAGAPVLGSANTGVSTGGTVAGFTDGAATPPASNFTSIIDWGDGSPNSVGGVSGSDGSYSVQGTHKYARPGTYATTVVVTDPDGAAITLNGSTTVTDPSVTGSTRAITAIQGIDTGPIVLATFVSPNTLATVADLGATLAANGWGDGSPTGDSLQVVQIGVTPLSSPTNPGAPIFQVLGGHTYSQLTPAGSTDTLSFVITTLGGSSTTLTSPLGGGVSVIDARLTGSAGTNLTGFDNTPTGLVLLGTFTSANPGPTLGQLAATIHWGDSSTSAATITQPGGVGTPFQVSGSHTFTKQGVYSYTVSVASNGGQDTTITGTMTQIDRPPIAVDDSYATTAGRPPLSVPAGAGILANDINLNTNPNPAALTCALTSTPSHGQLTINPDGSFTYTPDAGFVGTDRFTYRDYDGQTTGNVATVTLVVNPAPYVIGDYTGDGKADPAVYLPSFRSYLIRPSSGGPDQTILFGVAGAGQSIPAPGDYDGDGKTDLAVYIPSQGNFGIRPSGGGPDQIIPFGISGTDQSIPAPGDYDGDGKTDLAVYIPSQGNFGIRPSGGGPDQIMAFGLGGPGQSIPAPGDYDGDGKTDLAVYIPSQRSFDIRPSGGGPDRIIAFGVAGPGQSIPMPGDYDGSGKTELAVYIPSQRVFAYRPANGGPDVSQLFGVAGPGQTLPAAGDYLGIGQDQLAAYLPSYGTFAIRFGGGQPDSVASFGIAGPGQSIPATVVVDQALLEIGPKDTATSLAIADPSSIADFIAPPTVKKKAARG